MNNHGILVKANHEPILEGDDDGSLNSCREGGYCGRHAPPGEDRDYGRIGAGGARR